MKKNVLEIIRDEREENIAKTISAIMIIIVYSIIKLASKKRDKNK